MHPHSVPDGLRKSDVPTSKSDPRKLESYRCCHRGFDEHTPHRGPRRPRDVEDAAARLGVHPQGFRYVRRTYRVPVSKRVRSSRAVAVMPLESHFKSSFLTFYAQESASRPRCSRSCRHRAPTRRSRRRAVPSRMSRRSMQRTSRCLNAVLCAIDDCSRIAW